ncbi:hypothetical protein HDU93_006668 [Gonapodya sp. JEL0774]|nr:hypothetical protein HDU93_006668 [Gonapodya sp. JEL0774]
MSRWGPTPSPPPLPSSVSPTPLYAPQPQRSVPIPQPSGNVMGAQPLQTSSNAYGGGLYGGQQAGQFTQPTAGSYGAQAQSGFYGPGYAQPGQASYGAANALFQQPQPGWAGVSPVGATAAGRSQPGQPEPIAESFSPSQFVQGLTAGNPAAQMGMDFAARMIAERSENFNQNVQPYLNVSSLKYYFAVSNRYVLNKLRLVVAPWGHGSWSRQVRRSQQGTVEGYRVPREDVNAPDLYIPAMAFVTYVLLVGVGLGQQDKFHPSQLGSTSTTAFALVALEVLLFRLGVYLLNVNMEGSTWDVVGVSGYKFIGIILTMFIRMTPLRGYMIIWMGLFGYTMVAYAIFLVRTLKYTVLPEQFSANAPAAAASTAHLPPTVKQRLDAAQKVPTPVDREILDPLIMDENSSRLESPIPRTPVDMTSTTAAENNAISHVPASQAEGTTPQRTSSAPLSTEATITSVTFVPVTLSPTSHSPPLKAPKADVSAPSPASLLLSNLLLLGFDPHAHSTLHPGLVLDAEMFSRNQGNSRAFEVVAAWLWERCEGEEVRKLLRPAYPCVSPASSREFRNLIFGWFSRLKREGKLSGPGTGAGGGSVFEKEGNAGGAFGEIVVRRSFLDECRGDRFERLMLAVSEHVVEQAATCEISPDALGGIPDVRALKRCMSDSAIRDFLDAAISREVDTFLITSNERVEEERAWELAVTNSQTVWEGAAEGESILTAHSAQFRSQRGARGTFSSTVGGEHSSETSDTTAHKVRLEWSSIEALAAEVADMSVTIDTIANSRMDELILDGRGVVIGLDESFKRWGTVFVKESINPYQSSCVDLVSLVKLWRLSLALLAHASNAVGTGDRAVGTNASAILADLPPAEPFPHPSHENLNEIFLSHEALLESAARLHARLVDESASTRSYADGLKKQHERTVTEAFDGLKREIEEGSLQPAPATPRFELRLQKLGVMTASKTPSPVTPAVVASIQSRVAQTVQNKKKMGQEMKVVTPRGLKLGPHVKVERGGPPPTPTPSPNGNYPQGVPHTSKQPVINNSSGATGAARAGKVRIESLPASVIRKDKPKTIRSPSKENKPVLRAALETVTGKGFRARTAGGMSDRRAFEKVTDQIVEYVSNISIAAPTIAPSTGNGARLRPPSVIQCAVPPNTPTSSLTNTNAANSLGTRLTPRAEEIPEKTPEAQCEPIINPMHAMDRGGFKTRAELPRTPVKTPRPMKQVPVRAPQTPPPAGTARLTPVGKPTEKSLPRSNTPNTSAALPYKPVPRKNVTPSQPLTVRGGTKLQDLSQRLAKLRGAAKAPNAPGGTVDGKSYSSPQTHSSGHISLEVLEARSPTRSTSDATLIGSSVTVAQHGFATGAGTSSFEVDRVFKLDLEDIEAPFTSSPEFNPDSCTDDLSSDVVMELEELL